MIKIGVVSVIALLLLMAGIVGTVKPALQGLLFMSMVAIFGCYVWALRSSSRRK